MVAKELYICDFTLAYTHCKLERSSLINIIQILIGNRLLLRAPAPGPSPSSSQSATVSAADCADWLAEFEESWS